MISPDRFNGAAVWKTLTSKQQAAIGAAALEVVAGRFCVEHLFEDTPFQTPSGRASDEAAARADQALDQAFVLYVPKETMLDAEERGKLPSVIGMICLTCGCSENDLCVEGCAWAGLDLCTACERKAPAPAEAGDAA